MKIQPLIRPFLIRGQGGEVHVVSTTLGEPLRTGVEVRLVQSQFDGPSFNVFFEDREAKELRDWLNAKYPVAEVAREKQ